MLEHKKLLQIASLSAILIASILVLAKFAAWIQTGSVSIQASLIDSLLDALTSLINFFVIHQALKPADKDHRFGHGKAEALGGLVQTAFITASAMWLLIDVCQNLFNPRPIVDIGIGNIIMVLAIILTAALVAFQRYVVKKTESLAISADSLHYQSDLLTCLGIVIGLNLTVYFNCLWLDSLIGIGIGFYILFTSYNIGIKSLNVLMDKELADDVREKILAIALTNPYVKDVHDLRTRSSGNQIFIQLHIDMDKQLDLQTAHDIGFEISQKICQLFPNADVMIHHDPV